MSSGHPLLRKQSRFAAKVETAAGTAVALSSSDGAMIIYDPSIDYDISLTKRQRPGSMSQLPGVAQARKASIKATVEMMGKGATGVPLWASTLLAASGFALTGSTYAPVTGSASATTISCGVYRDGRLRQACGVATDWTMKLDDGQPGMIDFTGEGCYVAPTATALISPTYPTVIPPIVRNITFTIGATTYTVPSIEIASGNTLYLREDVTTATGYLNAEVVDRNITFRISPESLPIGTKDWVATFLAGTTAALNIVLGSTANNTITITAPAIQLQSAPNEGERNGVVTEDLVFQCNDDGTEDDELAIQFS